MKKLTTEEFISRASETHENKYSYENTNYDGRRNPVSITCPIHGEFLQTPDTHLAGCGCSHCGDSKRIKQRTYTMEMFVDKAISVHGELYDYSKGVYITSKDKIEIVCSKHGSFWQRPNDHLNAQGCSECGKELSILKRALSTEEFIEKANAVHSNFYDYSDSNYINSLTKINIICPLHGLFEQVAGGHLQGDGCYNCGVESHIATIDEFVINAVKVHGDKYCYDNSFFLKEPTGSKVSITCPIHGDFIIWKNSFLKGHGCKQCSDARPGFSTTAWVKFCKDKGVEKPICYIVRLFDEKESFIKIGMTTDFKERMRHIPYDYEVIYLIENVPEIVFHKEKSLHKTYRLYKHEPLKVFNGQHECFTMSCFS